MKEEKVRRLAAIMFTDIVGYTALMQKDENTAVKIRTHHREVFQKQHELHQGEIIQYYGDGTLSVFQSAIEAVVCAIEIQRLLQQGNQVPLRIGLHMGDIVFDGTEVYGDGVNFASRIESMGVAGAILLSGKLNEELKNHQDISTTSMGHFGLKNIEKPVEVFAVVNEGIIIPDPSELKGKQKSVNSTIAVLPFINMSASIENEYFSDGMTEEIINALAKIKNLKVTSRTSSFFFKNKNIPVKEIGQELNVSTILEGSIRLSGDMIRITAQLINVADDFHFWSETWDRRLENVFSIQDEISLLIAEKLRENIGHFEIQEQLVKPQTTSIEAYENYLKGFYHYLKWNQKDMDIAIRHFEKALSLDKDHAESYVGLSSCYLYLASTGFLPSKEAFKKAKHYAEKALALDDQLPGVHFVLGGLSFWHKWNFEEAFMHINEVLKMNPSHAEAHHSLALILLISGKKETATKHINIAVNLDPVSINQKITQTWIYYMQEDYVKTIALGDLILEEQPESVPARIIRDSALILTKRQREVIEYYEGTPHPGIDISTKTGMIAIAHVFNKEQQHKDKYLKILYEQLNNPHAARAMAFIFLIHAVSGEVEEAINWLEKGLQNESPLLLFLIDDPFLNPIKENEKYKKVRTRVLGREKTPEIERHQKRIKKKPLLDEHTNQVYAQKLLDLMDSEKPYLQSNLNLRQLAAQIDIHPNQLSWLLNEYFGKSFNDFINYYRVEAFKQIAIDPKKSHVTLIGLAYESGFNSKTVFNTYFKKETGMTPSAYMKQG